MKQCSSALNMTMKTDSVRAQNISGIKENKKGGHVKAETWGWGCG